MFKITKAEQIKMILSRIPAEDFCTGDYQNGTQCCGIGHINKYVTLNPIKATYPYDVSDAYGAFKLVETFFSNVYDDSINNLATVNDNGPFNPFEGETPKERLMLLIEDMIAHGY